MKLELKDSQFLNANKVDNKGVETALYCQAVDKLNRDIKEKKVDFFSFSSSKQNKFLDEKIVWHEINSTRESNSNTVVNSATFFTSHYIGFYSTILNNKPIDIIIKPRFGNDSRVFNYLLSFAYGIYLPKGSASSKDEK